MGALLQDEGAFHRRQYLAGDHFHFFRVGLVVQQQNEFVTAHPAGDVAGADGVTEAARHFHQHLVTGLVAEGVVDGLVAVQVDVEHGHRRFVGQACIEFFGEILAVGQAGQGVVLRGAAQLGFQPFALDVLRQQARQHVGQLTNQGVALEGLGGEEQQGRERFGVRAILDGGEQGGLQAQLFHLVARREFRHAGREAAHPQFVPLGEHHGLGRVAQQDGLVAQSLEHGLYRRHAPFFPDAHPRAFAGGADVNAAHPVQGFADEPDHAPEHHRFVLAAVVLNELDDVGFQPQQQVLVGLAGHVTAHAAVADQPFLGEGPAILFDLDFIEYRLTRQRQGEELVALGQHAEFEVADAPALHQGFLQPAPAGIGILQQGLACLLQVLGPDLGGFFGDTLFAAGRGRAFALAAGLAGIVGQLLGQLHLAGPGDVDGGQVPEAVAAHVACPVLQFVRNLAGDLADAEIRAQLPVPVGAQLGQCVVFVAFRGQLVLAVLALADVLRHAGQPHHVAVFVHVGRAHPAHPDDIAAVLHVAEFQVDALVSGQRMTVLLLKAFLVLGMHADEEGLLRDGAVGLFQSEHVRGAITHVNAAGLLVPHPGADVRQPLGQAVLGLQFGQLAVDALLLAQVLGGVEQGVGKQGQGKQGNRRHVEEIARHPFRIEPPAQHDEHGHRAGQHEQQQTPAQGAQVCIESRQGRGGHVRTLRETGAGRRTP